VACLRLRTAAFLSKTCSPAGDGWRSAPAIGWITVIQVRGRARLRNLHMHQVEQVMQMLACMHAHERLGLG
jgi:hypothetical protein